MATGLHGCIKFELYQIRAVRHACCVVALQLIEIDSQFFMNYYGFSSFAYILIFACLRSR